MTTTYNLNTNQFLSRLQLKKYSAQYTPIKAALFPAGELDRLYSAIDATVEDAPEPFTVSANPDGSFKNLFCPILLQQSNSLVVKLGDKIVPLSDRVSVTFIASQGSGVIATLNCNKKSVVLPVLIKEGVTVTADQLNNNIDKASSYLAEAHGNRSRYSVKLVDLPLQSFKIVNYTIYAGNSYDTLYLRAMSDEKLEFISAFDSETRQNSVVDIEAGELFTIVGNSKLLTLFRASPIVTSESPASLTILGVRTVMNKQTADVRVNLSEIEDFPF